MCILLHCSVPPTTKESLITLNVCTCHGFFQANNTLPGAMIPAGTGSIVLNALRRTVKLKVTSLCDRPIQVCTIKLQLEVTVMGSKGCSV